MGSHILSREPQALGQWQNNRQAQAQPPRSPSKPVVAQDSQTSPTKSTFASISAKFDSEKNTKESSPTKFKKPKSSTSLVGLLSRPRSSKNLRKLLSEAEARQGKDKENRTPPGTLIGDLSPPTPIYAQFCAGTQSVPSSPFEAPEDPFSRIKTHGGYSSNSSSSTMDRPGLKQRPRSFQPPYTANYKSAPGDEKKENRGRSTNLEPPNSSRSSTWAKGRSTSRGRVLTALSNFGAKVKSSSPTSPEATQTVIDPKDIDTHLEAMLDRRNIPENQRFKMRSLTNTIKMEFIRQDWAENEAKKLAQSPSNDADEPLLVTGSSAQDTDKKRSRGRSFTFSRNSWKLGPSPTKSKKSQPTVSRHSRHKSVDSITASDRPSASVTPTYATGIIAKVTGQQLPGDFVTYLRKVQKPESVEVGKLHKLRLLLRNERVAWAEDFIKQGGMREIVGLLHRIMEVEWR